MGALIELVDSNNANVNGRGSASRILRTRGVAQADGDTAVLAVTLVSPTGSPVSAGGGSVTVPAATSTNSVAYCGTPQTVKNTAGTLYGIVTQSGSVALPIMDGSTGAIIAVVPANQPVGDLPMYGGGRPFNNSLYVPNGANTPAVTLIYA